MRRTGHDLSRLAHAVKPQNAKLAQAIKIESNIMLAAGHLRHLPTDQQALQTTLAARLPIARKAALKACIDDSSPSVTINALP